MTTGAPLLIGASSADPSWDAIDWQTAERSVRRLQMRIAKATRAGRNISELRYRVRSLALERLERCEGKLSRTVLRGGSDRKVAPLPGTRVALQSLLEPDKRISHTSGSSVGHSANLRATIGFRSLRIRTRGQPTAASAWSKPAQLYALR